MEEKILQMDIDEGNDMFQGSDHHLSCVDFRAPKHKAIPLKKERNVWRISKGHRLGLVQGTARGEDVGIDY